MYSIQRPLRPIAAILLAAGIAAALAACGGDSGSSSDSTAAATSGSGADTVSTASISGIGDVLVDADGNALYANDQDTASAIACSGACAQIWVPLTVDAGTDPSSSDTAVASKLGVVTNPDGDTQVTLDGKPLYTFTQDSPGSATGDGVTDSFGGTTFAWTVATATGSDTGSGGGSAGGASTDSSSSDGGGYSYGGGY